MWFSAKNLLNSSPLQERDMPCCRQGSW